jgi:hypothetical protein
VQLAEPILIGIVVGLLFMGAAFSRKAAHMFEGEVLEAQRPWYRYANLAGGMWVISLIAFNFFQNTGRLSHPSLGILGVAVVTLIGVIGVWVEYRRLQAMDEFIRRIRLEAYALSFGLSLVGVVALALLAKAGIVEDIGFSKWGLTVMYALATSNIIVFLRYR